MARNLPPALDDEEDFPEPPRLRVLRLTVTGLMVVLALGVIVIAGTVAWRMMGARAPLPPVSAESLTLPEGREIVALGGDGPRLLVVTRDAEGAETLMTFRKEDGALLRETAIRRE